MKTVYSTQEIFHEWLYNYEDKDVRNGQGNVFSEGNIIYSYGHHFAMCRIVEIKKRNCVTDTVYLVNNDGYSNTTRRQMGYLRQALPYGANIFYVDSPERSPKYNAQKMMNNIVYRYKDELASAMQKRKIDRVSAEIDLEIKLMKNFIEYFKIKGLGFKGLAYQLYHKPINEIDIEKLRRAKQREKKRLAEKLRIQKEEAITEYRMRVEEWKAGKIRRTCRPSYVSCEYHFRLSECTKYIETSENARIRVKSALELIHDLKEGCAVNKEYDNMTCRQADSKYIIIGCHKIPTTTFYKYAKSLGLLGV